MICAEAGWKNGGCANGVVINFLLLIGTKKMPYKMTPVKGGKVKVTSPHGVKAQATTPEKAQKQVNLLRGVEHGWKPTKKK